MTPSLQHYVEEYEHARRARRLAEPAWLTRTRQESLARFLSLGFPTPRDEEWRFTNVAPLAAQGFSLSGETRIDALRGEVARLRLTGALAAELVFVNGHYVDAFSTTGPLPAGARIESLAASVGGATEAGPLTRLAPGTHHAFVALNTALFSDGASIRIPPGAILKDPVHLLFISTGDGATMSQPRVAAAIGAGSEVSIVETYAGVSDGRYFTNAVTELLVEENAKVDHYKRQYESTNGFHIATMHVEARRDATVTSHSVSLGGGFVRNDVTARLDGEGVDCTLNGLYLATGERLVDNHTTIDHARPHCGSREVYKGILSDRARGVFNGKVIVRPDAQKTDAKQTNRALLLSEDAQINTKPQLEIFANDVKCTHGAAIGQLDDEALFYLRARGLSEPDARHLLIRAFAAEVLGRMRLEVVRTDAEAVLFRQLALALPAAA